MTCKHAYQAYQGDEWQAPQAFLLSAPSAFAFALADQVDISTNGNIVAKGNGIVAVSKAVAEAKADDGNSAAVAISQDVNVTVNGNVTAGKTGILAGSVADADAQGFEFEHQGNVTVAVNKGAVTGGSGYYGIAILGGNVNTITVGKKASVTSLSRLAIYGEEGNETVENYGLVDGDVDLNGGSNAFNNYASGSFYSANVIDLNGGLLWNAGLLSPGGPGVIQTSALNGSLVQTNSGTYGVDLDLGNKVGDLVNATGTAGVDGKVAPTVIANPVSGKTDITIIHANGGVADNGAKVKDTAVVDYSLLFKPNDLILRSDVDFSAKGLNKDASNLGNALNKVFKNGGPNNADAFALALLQLPNTASLSNAFGQLSGENYRALEVSELYSQERFSDDQMNCPVRGDSGAYVAAPLTQQPLKVGEPARLGEAGYSYDEGQPIAAPFIDENQCVWARVRWRTVQQDANAGTPGFDEDAIGISGGGQWVLGGPWYGGVAFGYENSQIDTNSPVLNSDGDRFRVGGSLKYISGAWFVGGAVTGGWSNFDSDRHISFPGFSTVQTSSQDLQNVAGQMRVAYQMATAGTWYLKPLVDFNVTNVDMDSFTEKGKNGAELRVSSNDETVFSATPALEIGTQWGHPGGILTRPFVRGGVSFYNDANFPINAAFAAAPGASFTTKGEIDDVLGNVSAGVSFFGVRGGVLTFSYDGSFGDTFTEHSASAKASMRF